MSFVRSPSPKRGAASRPPFQPQNYNPENQNPKCISTTPQTTDQSTANQQGRSHQGADRQSTPPLCDSAAPGPIRSISFIIQLGDLVFLKY